MIVEVEFIRKEMNKNPDSRYDELMLVMSNDQAIEVLDREYDTKYIDDIMEGKLEADMIFKTQESIKVNDVMEEASSNITNPPKHGRISFSQSAPRDITYNLKGRYLITKGNYGGNNKDLKNYGKRQAEDEIKKLPTASNSGSILNLTAWDLQPWPEVIDRSEINVVRAWQNQTHCDDMLEFLETLLGETIRK